MDRRADCMTLLSAASAAGKTSQLRSRPCQAPGLSIPAHCVVNAAVIFRLKSSEADCPNNSKSRELAVGLEVGGYTEHPDWPKLGPSLLIATCLILAIRTAKQPPLSDKSTADPELDREIDYAIYLARRVLSVLLSKSESIFPQKREAWYQPSGDDVPK